MAKRKQQNAPSIRQQFEPLVRAVGLREAARLAEIDPSALANWLNEKPGRPGGHPRRLNDDALDRLAHAVGHRLALVPR